MGIIDDALAKAGAAEPSEPPGRAQSPASKNVQPQAGDSEPQEADAASGSTLTITPKMMREKMNVDPQMAAQLDKVIIAGKKVMFSEKTFGMLTDALNSPEGDLVQKLGTGITGLMALLIQESKASIPGELIIPAGLVLMAEAAQFLVEGGEQLDDKDVADAIDIFVTVTLHQTGLDADKMAEAGEKASQGGAPAAAAPAAPAAPAAGVSQ